MLLEVMRRDKNEEKSPRNLEIPVQNMSIVPAQPGQYFEESTAVTTRTSRRHYNITLGIQADLGLEHHVRQQSCVFALVVRPG